MATNQSKEEASFSGGAKSARFIWTCVNGCGECGVKRIEFEFSREETLDGRLISSATEPRLVSDCCGAELVMWDDEKDEEVFFHG